MQKKLLLTELIHDLEQEMLRLGYTKRSMEFYRRRWRTLLQFAKERREFFYSEQLGIDFVEKHFNVFEKDDNRGLSARDVQERSQLDLSYLCRNRNPCPSYPYLVPSSSRSLRGRGIRRELPFLFQTRFNKRELDLQEAFYEQQPF